MKTRTLLLISFLFLFFAPPLGQTGASSPGQWAATTDYPLHVAGDSCATYSDQVYCVGGFDANGNDYSSVYYAQLSPSGIGSWSTTSPYPEKVDSAACFTSGSALYCVGGENATTVFNQVYEAPITSSGLGTWSEAAAYPSTIVSASCVADSGYVYCVGGFNLKGEGSNSTYYASVASGIGSWKRTTAYPVGVYTVPCAVQSSVIYCVAGQKEVRAGGTGPINNAPSNLVFFAPLSSAGIGAWSSSSAFPDYRSSASCLASSGDVYCVGGYGRNQLSSETGFSSAVSAGGMGQWTEMSSYPIPFDLSSCVSGFSNIYCIAGRSFGTSGLTMLSSDYYIALGASASTSSSSSTSTSSSTESQSTSSASSTEQNSSSISSSSENATSVSGSRTSGTAPEFPNALAIPLLLVGALLVVAILAPRGNRSTVGVSAATGREPV